MEAMNSKTVKRVFYGFLAAGFLFVTVREFLQAGVTAEAVLTAGLGAVMAVLAYTGKG